MRLKAGFKKKQLIIFDLDGTLTPSKSALPAPVARSLTRLLQQKQVAIIGGGRFEQFEKQFIGNFRAPGSLLERLFLFPTTASAFYRFSRGRFRNVYEHLIPLSERKRITYIIRATASALSYPFPKKVYGKTIDDRGTQISFSALGQDIVERLGPAGIRAKAVWNKHHDAARQSLARLLRARLPAYSVKTGGLTTIDITKKGIDKAYGVRQIRKHLGVPIKDMLFVGDAMYPGGNDAAAKKTGVDWVQVSGPAETKRLIDFLTF